MTEQMNVPKLRFVDFSDTWRKEKLGNFVEINSGDSPSKFKMVEEGIPFFKVEQLNNSIKYQTDSIYFINEPKKVISKGSVIFPKRGASILLNKIRILKQPSFMDTNLMTLTVNEQLNNEYLYYFILREDLSTLADTTSIPQINNKHILPYPIALPTLPEQQKIASFLSKVDEKIALLTEKKDKLTEYKKGVMQQLFNGKWGKQDGQLTFIPPTLRFKADDGSEFPDWEEKKFGDCFDFFTTNSLSRDKLSYDMGMIKNIHYGDIHTKFRSIFKPEQELVPYIAELDDTKKIKPQSYCQNGDLVFADASEDYADIGKCIEVRELGNLKLVAGLHTHLARPKEKFATGYQAYLQKSWKMRFQIMRIAQGTKVLGISTKQLATIYLPVPCYEEQEKIAAFLISLDSKIECLEFELNKSKEWKRGLLQQMFV